MLRDSVREQLNVHRVVASVTFCCQGKNDDNFKLIKFNKLIIIYYYTRERIEEEEEEDRG